MCVCPATQLFLWLNKRRKFDRLSLQTSIMNYTFKHLMYFAKQTMTMYQIIRFFRVCFTVNLTFDLQTSKAKGVIYPASTNILCNLKDVCHIKIKLLKTLFQSHSHCDLNHWLTDLKTRVFFSVWALFLCS